MSTTSRVIAMANTPSLKSSSHPVRSLRRRVAVGSAPSVTARL
jgi:hypothetical protein